MNLRTYHKTKILLHLAGTFIHLHIRRITRVVYYQLHKRRCKALAKGRREQND